MSRNDPCFCGSGKKEKKCHNTIKPESKLADICRANVAFDKAVVEKDIKANCPVNCSICCGDFFYISENEFLIILDGLLKKGGKSLVNEYIVKAKEYEEYVKTNYPEIMNDLDTLMPTAKKDENREYFNDNYRWDRSKKCIFLESGKCAIYDDRPYICRTYGVCQTCEIINNEPHLFTEAKNLALTDLIQGKKIIVKRPYPIFYFFSFFLNKVYYDTTMIKLNQIRTLSEKDYANFCNQILM